VALPGHRDGLRVAGGSDALRPLVFAAEGQSKGSGSLGARSGNVATRHPQADPGHDPEPLENRTLKTHRFPGNQGCYGYVDGILNVSGPELLAFAPGVLRTQHPGLLFILD